MAFASNGNNNASTPAAPATPLMRGAATGPGAIGRPIASPGPQPAATGSIPSGPANTGWQSAGNTIGQQMNVVPKPAAPQTPAPTSTPNYAPAPAPQQPQPQPWQVPNWNWNQIDQLWGGNPLALLSGSSPGGGVMPLLNNINTNRAALGSNLLNNNGYGAGGTFSPVVTNNTSVTSGPLSSVPGVNSTVSPFSTGSQLTNFLSLMSLLGSGGGATSSNNFTV